MTSQKRNREEMNKEEKKWQCVRDKVVTVKNLLPVTQSGNGNKFVTGNKSGNGNKYVTDNKSGNGNTFVTGNKKW